MCGRTQNGISCRIVHDESLECLALSNAARASLVLEIFLRASSLVSWLVSQETNGFETATLSLVEGSHHVGTSLAHPVLSLFVMLEQWLLAALHVCGLQLDAGRSSVSRR